MSTLRELEPGTAARLHDVHRLCLRAEALAARGRGWFDSDPELGVPHLAADSLVLKLGEAVRRLPEEFLEERRADPTWRRAIGMRNRIAHEYDAVDYEIVWQVVSQHARALRITIEEILGQDG
ncbi:DUF86 domain-containing protein [Kytococcus sedentarius]|uniref:Uncharacterized conserved protein n=1 Tax=Kytococcus sedentarius (strain ATCC 14392 / DSM 20547 / JCM 11482 / CCUG 33030 / NBRC 15357 / NCTC 11040 / CCM 314 / 541) TaxID=478801 RepID=C7NKF1_KYTSD|nr:HepT-like ribonuclease domain-containing protein [Kytococcus sedentarius]ACV06989.1 uncharacterized conserved protein [Kytococcus sedentarius DSM 20547]QQB62989.1 DUF86 domain-containing protein [Kytococcus sedentarius]STX14183.1 Uncharacterized conserved protein [Kytococcus sedentarius]